MSVKQSTVGEDLPDYVLDEGIVLAAIKFTDGVYTVVIDGRPGQPRSTNQDRRFSVMNTERAYLNEDQEPYGPWVRAGSFEDNLSWLEALLVAIHQSVIIK